MHNKKDCAIYHIKRAEISEKEQQFLLVFPSPSLPELEAPMPNIGKNVVEGSNAEYNVT